MALPRILVLVLAGGAGGRLELLTDQRAKPAVPFAGRLPAHRLPAEQLPALRDRRRVGVGAVPPDVAGGPSGQRPAVGPRPHRRRAADAAAASRAPSGAAGTPARPTRCGATRELVREFDPDALVVVSSDAVYKLDYRDVVEAHLGSGAEVTMVTTEVAAGRRRPLRHRAGRRRRRGHRLRLQARRPGDDDGDQRGVRLHPGRDAGPAGGAGRRRGRRRARRPRQPAAARADQGRAAPAPTPWTATGATSAPCRRTGRRTATSSPPSHRSTSTTPPGRCTPAAAGTAPPGSSPARRSTRAWSPAAPAWRARSRGSVLSPGVVVEKGATVVDSGAAARRPRAGRGHRHPRGARRPGRRRRAARGRWRRRHHAGRPRGECRHRLAPGSRCALPGGGGMTVPLDESTARSWLAVAVEEARAGLAEGGIPIGAALFGAGRRAARPRPQPARAGRRPVGARRDGRVPRRRPAARRYRGTTMVTTLSPCWYCSGLVRQFGISRLVVGEARTFVGGHDWLAEHGVEVALLDDPECVAMMARLHRRRTRRCGTRTSASTEACLDRQRPPTRRRARGRPGARAGQRQRSPFAVT